MEYFIIIGSEVIVCNSDNLKEALAELRDVLSWNSTAILAKKVSVKMVGDDGDSNAEIEL